MSLTHHQEIAKNKFGLIWSKYDGPRHHCLDDIERLLETFILCLPIQLIELVTQFVSLSLHTSTKSDQNDWIYRRANSYPDNWRFYFWYLLVNLRKNKMKYIIFVVYAMICLYARLTMLKMTTTITKHIEKILTDKFTPKTFLNWHTTSIESTCIFTKSFSCFSFCFLSLVVTISGTFCVRWKKIFSI